MSPDLICEMFKISVISDNYSNASCWDTNYETVVSWSCYATLTYSAKRLRHCFEVWLNERNFYWRLMNHCNNSLCYMGQNVFPNLMNLLLRWCQPTLQTDQLNVPKNVKLNTKWSMKKMYQEKDEKNKTRTNNSFMKYSQQY